MMARLNGTNLEQRALSEQECEREKKTVPNFRVQRKIINNACRAELGCFPPILTGSLKGGQPAYVHAPVCVCMCVGVCVKTHLEAVQLEPPAVSKRDLP